MKTLREYQRRAVDSIKNYLEFKIGNPVVAAPTGSGKSLIIAYFIKEEIEKKSDKKIIIVTHVKELAIQNYEEFYNITVGINCGIYSAGLNRKNISQVTFATIGSIVTKTAEFGHIDYLLIDEVHMADTTRETMYKKFINGLAKNNPKIRIIGFSATPYRLGQGLITEDGIFTDICFDNTRLEDFNYLLEEGYLDYLITKKTLMQIDVTKIHTLGGEFKQNELQETVNTYQLIHTAISESMPYINKRKCIVIFAAGIEHSINITNMLNNEFGISAKSIHSNLSNSERNAAISDFKAGKFKIAVNNIILGIGVNIPQIDMIIDLHPTKSTSRHVQKYGRGTRPCYADGYDLSTKEGRRNAIKAGEKPHNCLVLDFAGNTFRNGAINDPIIPIKNSQIHRSKSPYKICKKCLTIHPRKVKICNTYNYLTDDICDYEFNKYEDPDLTNEASNEDIIVKEKIKKKTNNNKISEWFTVKKILYYSVKNSNDGIPMLAVKYECNEQDFIEYICIEHKGFLKKHASNWWEVMCKDKEISIPNNVIEALKNLSSLNIAKNIYVNFSSNIPKIQNYKF
jgi:DNA repair protein RadD